MNTIITCSATPDGVLYPTIVPALNPVDVTFKTIQTEDGLSGTLSWHNKTQAFLHYDMDDKIIIGFTVTDLTANAHITEASIVNILKVI